MVADDKIDPLGSYRGIRPLKEGTVFAKFKIRKKSPKRNEKAEQEKLSAEKKSEEHRIDIEA